MYERVAGSEPGRSPELDGLRGVAILLVMLFHFTIAQPSSLIDGAIITTAKYGWCGVNLFFVLSGFLITGILVDSKGNANFFRNFYIRRALRILPLYYTLVAGLILLYPLVGGATVQAEARSLVQNQWWVWTHTMNWFIARTGDWAAPLMTGGFWSLAIEEQFYLVWPVVIYLCSRQSLFRLCLMLVLVGVSTRLLMAVAGAHSIAVYTVTFSQLDPLAVGAAIALIARSPSGLQTFRSCAPPIAVISLFSFAFLETALSHWRHLYRKDLGSFILIPEVTCQSALWGAILVIVITAGPSGTWSRILRSRVLVVLGTYSYALYLFHGHLYKLFSVLGINGMINWQLFGSILPAQVTYWVLAILASLAVSYGSWHVYEKHFLKLKRWFPSGSVAYPAHTPVQGGRGGDAWDSLQRVR